MNTKEALQDEFNWWVKHGLSCDRNADLFDAGEDAFLSAKERAASAYQTAKGIKVAISVLEEDLDAE